MGRLIEESKVIEILQTSWLNGTVAHRIIDEIKQRIKLEAPTVEAIPKADYENRLKADLVAMLTELKADIDIMSDTVVEDRTVTITSWKGMQKRICKLIQSKIDKLREE